jgi:hypothetical protein
MPSTGTDTGMARSAAFEYQAAQKLKRSQRWQKLKQDPERYDRWKAESRLRMRQMYARKKAAKQLQQLHGPAQ